MEGVKMSFNELVDRKTTKVMLMKLKFHPNLICAMSYLCLYLS